MTDQADFEFMKSLAVDFFNKKTIKDTISIIEDSEITGWEKWLQIEFSKFINDRDNISDWVREWRYDLDKRSSKSKSKCSIDFSIKQKHKHSWIAVEIKQINSAASCIKSMHNDILKVYKIKQSQDDIRSIWCIGVHIHEDPLTIKSLIAKNSTLKEIELNHNHFLTKKIGKTGFSFTLF